MSADRCLNLKIEMLRRANQGLHGSLNGESRGPKSTKDLAFRTQLRVPEEGILGGVGMGDLSQWTIQRQQGNDASPSRTKNAPRFA